MHGAYITYYPCTGCSNKQNTRMFFWRFLSKIIYLALNPLLLREHPSQPQWKSPSGPPAEWHCPTWLASSVKDWKMAPQFFHKHCFFSSFLGMAMECEGTSILDRELSLSLCKNYIPKISFLLLCRGNKSKVTYLSAVAGGCDHRIVFRLHGGHQRKVDLGERRGVGIVIVQRLSHHHPVVR